MRKKRRNKKFGIKDFFRLVFKVITTINTIVTFLELIRKLFF